LTLPATLLAWPERPASAAAWGGLAYVTVFSMWLGFFAWYRGLAIGGAVRVSQVQLVQPFLSMLFAVPVLGERLDAATVGFALAVVATVFVGRSLPAGRPAAAPLAPSFTTRPT
jgi:drug/metabolite transporter (DMT)-like permease